MAIATIAQAILRGDISTYLAANDNSSGVLWGQRLTAPMSPITILMVTDALRWGNAGGAQTNKSLREVTNYLVWLIGMYGQQAQYISEGAGGGTVIPDSGVGLPNPYDWVVGATTSDTEPLASGDTTVILPAIFAGYNIEYTRNNLTQNTTSPPDGVSTYYGWNRVTRAFTLYNGAAQLGEQMRILPTR